jgi:hypothetical protein
MRKDAIFVIAVIIIIILVFGLGYYLKDYLDKQKRINEITLYKKEFYDGVLCQYSCPIESQVVNNKTQELPTLDCVKNCTNDFRTKYAKNDFSEKELTKDNLLKEITSITDDCKTNNYDATKFVLNNTAYFSCAKEKLLELKEKYKYL